MVSDNVYYIGEQHATDRFFDTFCGGGGSGSGILNAYKRLGVQAQGTFVNHWDKAIEIHEANHPEHRHFREDLFLMDPTEHMPKTTYRLGWSSPSCQQFSVSRGNRPINEQGRTHANTVVDWIAHCRPECQIVENVVQFLDYGPLRQRRDKKGKLLWAKEVPAKKKGTTKVIPFHNLPAPRGECLPVAHRMRETESEKAWEKRMVKLGYDRHLEPDPGQKGKYFKEWRARIEALGYVSDYRVLCSADYGDPTIRKRLFVMFVRKDTGKRIVWPDQRFIKPNAKRPKFRTDPDRPLQPWPTARNSVIDWSLKGTSIFHGRKPLASATMRRIAIGTAQFGLKEFFVPASNFGGDRVRSSEDPVSTIQCNHRGEGLAQPQPFVLPKDQGHLKDYVKSIDSPVSTVQTTAVDGLIEPCVVQLNGQSTAMSVNQPLGALTGCQKHYVAEPFISHLRNGNGNSSVDQPTRTFTAAGQHQMLAEAFLTVVDNVGSTNDGNRVRNRVFSPDEPIRTLPTKNNHTLTELVPSKLEHPIQFKLEELEDAVLKAAPEGYDIDRVREFLYPLMSELKKRGRVDVRPWVYVYYSSGSVGSDIDAPVPTIRCKEHTAICYPVLEFDGEFVLLDILYRMLSVKELLRAQGFPDNFVWPKGVTKSEVVKAIGNSVSCGVAEALTLAWYSQDENIEKFYV